MVGRGGIRIETFGIRKKKPKGFELEE